MQEKSTERRSGDRRVTEQSFDGPERRMQGRRAPDGPPQARPDLSALSDIDLCRAYLRNTRLPGDPDGDALAAEMARRQLSF